MPAKLYDWSAEQDYVIRQAWHCGTDRNKLTAAISDAVRRIGRPRNIVRQRAQRLGLTVDTRRPWQAAELEFLGEQAGEMSVKRIARRLGRATQSVEAQMERRQLSRRMFAGYTREDVAALLGISPQTVNRWLLAGLLALRDGRITEPSVCSLIFQHPELYTLRRVDERLFKAIVFQASPSYRLPTVHRQSLRKHPSASSAGHSEERGSQGIAG